MKKGNDEKKKLPHFKDLWTYIPISKLETSSDTVSEWVKTIIEKTEGVGKSILIVDNEINTLNALKEILEYYAPDYKITTAINGIEALDKLSHGDFDLILSDIRMPMMDGKELSEICKKSPDLSHIPIILFSGYYNTLDFESSADYFLAKPIDSESLIKIIKRIFEKYQIIREVQKIGESHKKLKFFQIISIEDMFDFSKLKNLLDFIWVFQPNSIPLFRISYKAKLNIEEVRELLEIVEKEDTVLIVKEAPLLRELLKSEITFIGGNPSRIFESLEDIKAQFDIWQN